MRPTARATGTGTTRTGPGTAASRVRPTTRPSTPSVASCSATCWLPCCCPPACRCCWRAMRWGAPSTATTTPTARTTRSPGWTGTSARTRLPCSAWSASGCGCAATRRCCASTRSSAVVHRPTAEERVLAQHRRVAAQPQQLADQAEQGNLVRADVPVHPGDLVVLAVGVVVAVLGAPHLIARQQHRHAGGQQQGSQQVALQLATDGVDGRVVGRTLDAAVPGPVLVVPVPVALAVGLVVLSLVRRQVPQRETVVRGDEVDRGERPPTVVLVEVAGAGEPATEFADPGPCL